MSLWTPYADERALDLSAPKAERVTPDALERRPEAVARAPYELPWVPYEQFPAYEGPMRPLYCCPPPHRSELPIVELSPTSSTHSWAARSPLQPAGPPSPPQSPPARAPLTLAEETLTDDAGFLAFEREALRAMAERNGGSLVGSNPRMRRAVTAARADDDAYRRQRERNNHAAKESRDRRKMREIKLALKVAYLTRELTTLRAMLADGHCIECRRR